MVDDDDTVWNPYLVHVVVSTEVFATGAMEAQNIAEHLMRSAVDTAGEVDSEGKMTLTIHRNGGRFDGVVMQVTTLCADRMHRCAISPAPVAVDGQAEQDRAGGQPDRQ